MVIVHVMGKRVIGGLIAIMRVLNMIAISASVILGVWEKLALYNGSFYEKELQIFRHHEKL